MKQGAPRVVRDADGRVWCHLYPPVISAARTDPVISAIVDVAPQSFATQLDIAAAIGMAER